MADSPIALSKTCTKCGDTKPVEDFPLAKSGIHGRRGDCRVCRRAYCRKWYQHLSEDHLESRYRRARSTAKDYHAEWRERNKEHVRAHGREKMRKIRLQPQARLKNNVARAVHYALKGGRGTGRTFALLGYTLEELSAHLERQFLSGMNWENYSRDGWHVDHIRPLCSFTYESPDDPQFREAWALSNLQPLWAEDNIKKGGKITVLV